MTLQQLRYFCVMAEVLHYTHAADLLYISQPSLSYSLSKLEEELEIPLFEKQGKRVTLTKYGEEFLPYAKRALAELARGQEHLKELNSSAMEIVSLGFIYSSSFSILPNFVEKYFEHIGSRDTHFRFHQGMTGGLIEQLLNGTIDLMIAGDPGIDSLEGISIAKQELFLAVPSSHHLAGRKSVTLKDIADERFISITHDAQIYRHLADKFKSANFTPNIVFEADEYSSMAASVRTGAGIAIMPRLPMMEDINLKLLPFSDKSMSRDIYLLRYSLHTMSSAVQRVWEFAAATSPLLNN